MSCRNQFNFIYFFLLIETQRNVIFTIGFLTIWHHCCCCFCLIVYRYDHIHQKRVSIKNCSYKQHGNSTSAERCRKLYIITVKPQKTSQSSTREHLLHWLTSWNVHIITQSLCRYRYGYHGAIHFINGLKHNTSE